MGVLFSTRTPEKLYDRCLYWMSHSKGRLFHEIAQLVEEKIGLPCGITGETYLDNYSVNDEEFVPFFERFMAVPWQGEGVEHLYGWAQFAAGMVTNMTWEPRPWFTPGGRMLLPTRMDSEDEEVEAMIEARSRAVREAVERFNPQYHPPFHELSLEEYAKIIRETPLDD